MYQWKSNVLFILTDHVFSTREGYLFTGDSVYRAPSPPLIHAPNPLARISPEFSEFKVRAPTPLWLGLVYNDQWGNRTNRDGGGGGGWSVYLFLMNLAMIRIFFAFPLAQCKYTLRIEPVKQWALSLAPPAERSAFPSAPWSYRTPCCGRPTAWSSSLVLRTDAQCHCFCPEKMELTSYIKISSV